MLLLKPSSVLFTGIECPNFFGFVLSVLSAGAGLCPCWLNAQAIANTAWAFATTKASVENLFIAWARRAESRVSALNVQNLAKTAKAFATMARYGRAGPQRKFLLMLLLSLMCWISFQLCFLVKSCLCLLLSFVARFWLFSFPLSLLSAASFLSCLSLMCSTVHVRASFVCPSAWLFSVVLLNRCGKLMHIRCFPPWFTGTQRWRLFFVLFLLSCVSMGNCTRNAGASTTAADVHLGVCNTGGANVAALNADLNAINRFDAVCRNEFTTRQVCQNATMSCIGQSLYNLSNTTAFFNKTYRSWNACFLPQLGSEANKIQKHIVVKVWPTRMLQIPVQALDMFWHARGLNKYLLLALCLVCTLFTAGCDGIHRMMAIFGYGTDNQCPSPASAPATGCSEQDVSRIQVLQQELGYIMFSKHRSKASNALDDVTCLGWRRLSILSSLCKPFLREGQMCYRSETSVLYLFQVLCTHGKFQYVLKTGHALLQAQIQLRRWKDRKRRIARKISNICRASATSRICSQKSTYTTICSFSSVMQVVSICHLATLVRSGSLLSFVSIVAWCLRLHCASRASCRCLSMWAVWVASGNDTRGIIWSLVAYLWPLYPPDETIASQHAQPMSSADLAIVECFCSRNWSVIADESDPVEALVRARLPRTVTQIRTNGDGACAVHSVWGIPDQLKQLTCVGARALAAQAMGDSLAYLRTHIAPEFRDDVVRIATCLWSEFALGYLKGKRTNEIMSFIKHLPSNLLQEAQACALRLPAQEAELKACRARICEISSKVFTRTLEESMIRPLAIRLGVIPADCNVFAMTAADLSNLSAQCRKNHDFLAAACTESGHIKGTDSAPFPCYGPPSKYHSLFDSNPGFDGVRCAFLDSGGASTMLVIQHLEHHVATGLLQAEEANFVQDTSGTPGIKSGRPARLNLSNTAMSVGSMLKDPNVSGFFRTA